jgi:hypothetical protein
MSVTYDDDLMMMMRGGIASIIKKERKKEQTPFLHPSLLLRPSRQRARNQGGQMKDGIDGT